MTDSVKLYILMGISHIIVIVSFSSKVHLPKTKATVKMITRMDKSNNPVASMNGLLDSPR